MQTTKIEISTSTIFTTVLTLLGLWVLYQIKGIIILVFISFILMTAFNPIAAFAKKRRIPILPIFFLIYIGILALFSMVIASLLPAVVDQSKALGQNLPAIVANLEHALNVKLDPALGNSYLANVPTNVLRLAAGALSNILNILAIFFMTYYLTLERPSLHRYLTKLFTDGGAEKKAEELVAAVERRVGGWVRGELFLMLIIGVMTYFGLLLLGVPYALPLAVLAGTLELVPNLGPIIAAIPAIIIGLTISPMIGLGTTVLSILVQQLENNLIVPRIMLSATGTKPLITILVLLTGYTLGGAMGAILSMPLFLAAQTAYEHISRDQARA